MRIWMKVNRLDADGLKQSAPENEECCSCEKDSIVGIKSVPGEEWVMGNGAALSKEIGARN
ncbi:hypothetical protein TWF281_003068 [Arthrobotrys megalospora]